MKSKTTEIGPVEARLLSWSQMTGKQCVQTEFVAELLRIPRLRASELLDRMSRDGAAVQLKRGLYLLPEKLPPGGRWQPPVELAVWYYLKAKDAKWQETGLAAFNFHGLSEQIANVLTVYNDKVSGRRKFGKLEVEFIKVDLSRLGGAVEIQVGPSRPERRRIGTLARVVFDAVYDYSRFGTLPKAYDWIAARKQDSAFLRELVGCALTYGNIATRRRLGWLLEKLEIPERTIGPLRKSLLPTSSLIPLDPNRPTRGRISRDWGILDNVASKGVESVG